VCRCSLQRQQQAPHRTSLKRAISYYGAVLPGGKARGNEPVYAGWFSQNGNGEMTGTTWIDESGELWGPVLTNTSGANNHRAIALPHERLKQVLRKYNRIAR
jgi:L-aminopeptidase/D-esterase-like protein